MRPITPEDKKRIYNVLADAYIEVIDRQMIGPYERKVIAKKVLDAVEGAKTMDDINKFIHELVKNYPFFQFADKMFESEVKEIQQAKVITHLEQFLHSVK